MALEASIREALSHPPCAVAFSGGRDSSALLALAVQVSQREGLPPPIAITCVYDDPNTDELAWRRIVLDHLGVDDVEVFITDEHVQTGAPGEAMYRRNGLQFPSNSIGNMTLAERIPGGTLISGTGGDEMLGWTADPVFRWFRHQRPRLKDVARFAKLRRPGASADVGHFMLREHHWIRDSARPRLEKLMGGGELANPARFDAAIRAFVSARYYLAMQQSRRAAGDFAGATIVAPFFDRRFMAAWANANRRAGPRDRSAAMDQLFGDLLPTQTLHRQSKAGFNAAYHRVDEEFLSEWKGEGVPTELVDIEALRHEWSKPAPHGMANLLLQRAYFTWKQA
ncbi:MAG: asparagine synthase-related protein [Ilumatobacteraceae bacterium]